MRSAFAILILLMSASAHAWTVDCSTQLAPLQSQAEKCLLEPNLMNRFSCVNPLREQFNGPKTKGCQAYVTQYLNQWDAREHKMYKRNVVTITGNADADICRAYVPKWTAALRKCVENKNDKKRALCAEHEEKALLPKQKVCFLSQHRLMSLVSLYEAILYPNRQPAMMVDGPVIVLKPERKAQRSAK